MINKIGIIGHFGGNKTFLDGQTVKTKTIYNALAELNEPQIKLTKADTYFIKKNPFKFLYQFLNCINSNKKIIVLLSSNGRKVLFPILYILSKYFKKDIYHDAIGGRLANEVNKNSKWNKYVNSFSGNWMESTLLVENLKKCQIKNAIFIPNFKCISPLNNNEINTKINKPYNFCIFSRVTKKKGIIDAIDAIKKVNETKDEQIAHLDIYGYVEKNFENEFNSKLLECKEMCDYKGVVAPELSTKVLKNYYCLLFPTHWKYEGIPGTIIDSLCSGVPVIARRWQYCDEMIKHGITGYIYEFDEPEKLYNCILHAIENEKEVVSMKYNCINEANKYNKDNVVKIILKEMGILN